LTLFIHGSALQISSLGWQLPWRFANLEAREPNAPAPVRLTEKGGGMTKLLWMQNAGYYGQYLYGREHMSLSPRAEALGDTLAVLFDIAEPAKQDSILQSTPVMGYAIPCMYPQTAGIPPYHNNAVWPFVEAFWSLAAAKRENVRYKRLARRRDSYRNSNHNPCRLFRPQRLCRHQHG
jgi:hypothetical protein